MVDNRKPEVQETKEVEKNFKHIVRIMNTDLDGNKSIQMALQKIKGVGFMFSNLICTLAKVPQDSKTGTLDDASIKRLNEVVENPLKFNAPTWFLNRRKDYEDGTDKHLLTSDLDFTKQNDIRRLQKIKSYRGIRHHLKLPTRGQRTKSNFRRNKGKVTGVKKKAPGKK